MFGWVRRLFAQNRDRELQLSAKFDHAQTTDQNYRHWVNADSLGPIASLTQPVRKTLRDRCRYEVANDPHLAGLLETIAYDTIGSGPRLQIISEAPQKDVRTVEKLFAKWARVTRFAECLRMMVKSRRVDGEVFATLSTDLTVPHPVKFRLIAFESDLVCDPMSPLPPGNWEDGIDYDEEGRPRRYAVQNWHPGDRLHVLRATGYTIADADQIMHYFKPLRPGQLRGVSEFASALGTVSQLRRYSNAVLSAAEFAASLSATLETDGAPEDEPVSVVPMEKFQLEQNMAVTMPAGWKINQFKAEQPTTSYKDYTAEKRNEIARPVNAPFNVMTGNSSGYNYSSGRLDHVPYHRNTWIDRTDLEIAVTDNVIRQFLLEASKLGLIPASLGPVDEVEWECQWDGFNSIDPYKDAQASQLRMQIGLTTLAEECAAEGRSWRDVLEQQAVEMGLRRELGLSASTVPQTDQAEPGAVPEVKEEPEDEIDESDDTEIDRPAKPAEQRGSHVLV